ncbi:mRNA splicing protein prp28 [Savitreella phatthalungensis]
MSRQPIDLDELINQKRRETEERAKPKFLTTTERQEQRQALALERRAREAEHRYRQLKSTRTLDRTASETDQDAVQPGNEGSRKRPRHNADSRKVKFDWDDADDTSREDSFVPSTVARARASGHGLGSMTKHNGDAAFSASVINALPLASSKMPRDRAAYHNMQTDVLEDDVHWSVKPLAEMKERDWRIFKEDFGIQLKGKSLPLPLRCWDEAAVPHTISRTIQEIGYRDPSPIQRAAIPIGLAGRDIIGVAQTGSGKTAAFLIPVLSCISSLPPISHNPSGGPYALVMAPTRELAQQIEIEARKFAAPLGVTVVSIVGGRAIEEQSWNMRDGAEILIATPGRLLDCLERHVLVLNQCSFIVMDEADRMVDLGFEDAVKNILDALPGENDASRAPARQTVMFSATMPSAVEKLANRYLQQPAMITIGAAGQAVLTVEQRVEMILGEDKRRKRMEQILNSGEFDSPVIVFVNTKKTCESLARYLADIGWRSTTLHGGKSQDQRESALAKLRAGQVDCLVATDLAGRGIDVPGVTLVINFTMSRRIEDYIHRIGRTGRAGRKGTAITFVGEDDEALFYDIKVAAKNAPRAILPAVVRQAARPSRIVDLPQPEASSTPLAIDRSLH